jgi:hypothetical protein
MEREGRWESRQRVRTALLSKEDLGWAVITHPFHPLRGQRLRILKARNWLGQPTYILEGGECGTVTMPQEWTDRDPFDGVDGKKRILGSAALLELVALTEALKGLAKKV